MTASARTRGTVGYWRISIFLGRRQDDDGDIGFTVDPAIWCTAPTAEYAQAVHALHQQLMTPMRLRIDDLHRRGGLGGINLDLTSLRHDHDHRTQWLARDLARPPATGWDAVRHGPHFLLDETPHPAEPSADQQLTITCADLAAIRAGCANHGTGVTNGCKGHRLSSSPVAEG